MSIDLNILKNFDIDNDGILNPDEKSAYDAHAEQNDLVKLKDSVKNLKDNLDLNALGSLDIDGDGLLTSPEAENYKDPNALQLDSSHFAKHSYNMDIDFANQWVNNFDSEVDQDTMTYFLLLKEFGSDELALEIMRNAERTESEGTINLAFSVNGVDYNLRSTNDNNPEGPVSAHLTNIEDGSSEGVHYNPAFENGVSFASEYTNVHGLNVKEWKNTGEHIITSEGKDPPNLLQLDSGNFSKHSHDMDIDFANQWFNNFDTEVDQDTVTYFLLLKEFGSDKLALEIMRNAERTESEGTINLAFSVDGVDYSLKATKDAGEGAASSAYLTNLVEDSTEGVHYNPAFENGVSFASEYKNDHGSTVNEWKNAGGETITVDGLALEGQEENGMGFTRFDVVDASNYSQINDDGTVIHVEDGLIVSGRYADGIEFTREHSTVDNLSYIERQSNGQFLDVRNGQLVAQGDAAHIPEQGRSITEGISNYRHENGLIMGGVLENGLEFERFDIIDNKNYYQVNSDGSTSQVVNGEMVSQDDDFGISDRDMRFANLQSLEDIDTSIIDPDGSKFNRMMNAFNINSTESIDYYDSWIDDWVGTGPVDDSLKNNIVDKFLLVFGNDEQFMQAIEENGFNITIASEIKGSNPYGDQWNIAGFYSPTEDTEGRNTIVISEEALNSILFTHEFAHARDHLVDGSIDGSFGDIDSNTFDNAIAVSRERANNGAAQGLFDLDYASINDEEFLASMFEAYYLDPALFEQRFPEFTAALGETFDHLDQTMGLLSLNETTTDRMFDDFQNIASHERFA
ncbi:MAG: zinc-dependent peptidase [Candidatus Caenarcaniphilales bacterium]|nr:zinc-dependent peptidase [Candidatus Caenarcaniphilales bacterium]